MIAPAGFQDARRSEWRRSMELCLLREEVLHGALRALSNHVCLLSLPLMAFFCSGASLWAQVSAGSMHVQFSSHVQSRYGVLARAISLRCLKIEPARNPQL